MKKGDVLIQARDFTQRSTIHGVADITAHQQHPAIRALWFILTVGCTIFLIEYSAEKYQVYYSYPSTSRLSTTSRVMPLPAISFLNTNELRLSKITGADLISQFGEYYFGTVVHSNGSEVTFNEQVENLLDMEVINNLKAKAKGAIIQGNKTEFNKDFFRRVGHQKNDMIISCNWTDGTSSDVPCENVTTITSGYIWPFGNVYTINSDRKLALKRHGIGGLNIHLNTELQERLGFIRRGGWFKDSRQGIYMVIHANNLNNVFGNHYKLLDPSINQIWKVSMARVSLQRYLGPPWENCNKSEEYLEENCINTCITDHFYDRHGCKLYDMMGVEPLCISIDNNYFTTRNSRMNYSFIPFCQEKCFTSCYNLQFHYEVGNTKHPYFQGDKFYGQMLIQVLAADKLEFNTIDQIATLSGIDVLSDLGGMMGLFIGASILSLVQFLLFIVNIIYNCLHLKL